MPTFFMKLGFDGHVIQGADNLLIHGRPAGVTVDLGINYYRGLPASAIEKLELAIDGEPVDPSIILFGLHDKLVPFDLVPLLFDEFWGAKDTARLHIFNGGLTPGAHQLDVTLHLRNVSMQFGPGQYGFIDSSASGTVTVGQGREFAPYHGPARPPLQPGIERAVSTYCFTERFIKDPDYGIAEVFADIAGFGVSKVELIGPQVFHHYPTPTQAEIDAVLAAADEHGIEIYSYGGYVDMGRVSGHDMDDAEQLNDLIFDLITAKRLGASLLRIPFTPDNLPQVARLAEIYQIRIGCEIHAPEAPRSPRTLALIEALGKLKSPWVGLVPDFGCFIERPSSIAIERFEGLGARRDLLDYIIEHRWSGLDEHAMAAKIAEMGGGEAEKMAVSEWFGYMSFAPADLEGFQAMLPYCIYYHGKYYHIEADLTEPTIPYETLLRMIVESGFHGVLLTEYEGHAFYRNDAVEQVGRQLELERRILATL
jgi:sugar phosphate isomerase/epimerase